MGFRSVSEARDEAGSAAMQPREDPRDRQSASHDSGEGHRFGVETYRAGQETVLQRLAQQHGADQVRQWAAEGMPIETMGKTRDMAAFRERQRERSPEVPTDIERQNAKSVQRSRGAHHGSSFDGETQVPDSVRSVVSSSGQQLDESIQRAMEDRMGDNLGDVRIHTGPQASKACDDINARAFTVGNHIAFNRGEYDPESAEGQHVLAHELAHVRQQTGGAVSMLPQEGELAIDPDEQLEREAEQTAERVMRGGTIGVYRMRRADVHVQRIPEDTQPVDLSDTIRSLSKRLSDENEFDNAVPSPNDGELEACIDDTMLPDKISEARFELSFREMDDWNIVYIEEWPGDQWQCRWGRHDNPHNSRDHYHQPPDAEDAIDANHPSDIGQIKQMILSFTRQRIGDLWDDPNYPAEYEHNGEYNPEGGYL